MDTNEQITQEQRKRAELNRLAAVAKRRSNGSKDPWKLFKCQKIIRDLPKPQTLVSNIPNPNQTHAFEKFRVWLEICSPDSFSIAPVAIEGVQYPGEAECLKRLSDCLSDVIPSHYTQNHDGGKACVFKLSDYDMVLKCLRNLKGIKIDDIPWGTLNVVQRLSHSFITGQWIPCRPEHFTDIKVDQLIENLPKSLLDILRPFQLDGVRFGLRRGGRCLIADEMGLGKTLQAIAIAGCFMNEGPILVVCPAILRFSWAEEFERWLCLPADIHLVFSHQNNPANLAKCPKVVVTSYTMLQHLQKSMLKQEWALLIIDESHHVRCSKKTTEADEIKVVLDLATKLKRIVLLSGTPSLSRPYDIFHQINMLWPGLLGKNKYDFAKTYCSLNFVRGSKGRVFQDFSKGIRLEELNVLLKQTVMIRRLKEHVLAQLPPKRRQIIRMVLKKSDVVSARAAMSKSNCDDYCRNFTEDWALENDDEPLDSCDCRICSENDNQLLGIAKLSGFCEWLSIHPIISGLDDAAYLDSNLHSHKMIIFAHHIKVLDGIQEFICEKGIGFVRIDGNTHARDRHAGLLSFKSSIEVKIAIVGLLVCSVGVDFSMAQHVVFLELPQNPAILQQAEDRAHRFGQINMVNIYIFCAKDTSDESRWQNLNKSLRRVSSTTNGKYDAIQEIAVEDVSFLERPYRVGGSSNEKDLKIATSCELSSVSMVSPNLGVIQNTNFGGKYAETTVKDDKTVGFGMQNDSGTEIGFSGKTSFCNLDVGFEDENQPVMSTFLNKTELDNDGKFPEVIADKTYDKSKSLRFEVSQYTGRIHLYSCIPGTDSRPRPLFENFRPEELELLDSPDNVNEKSAFKFVKENPLYRGSLLAFINEWNKLRPIQQKKLRCKPLQLPLAVELCYLEDNINHNNGGLLKGGSTRRNTPLCDVSHPLPSNSVWRKVPLRSGCGRKERVFTQGWTKTDEPLCKLCQNPCTSNNAKTPEFFEDLFCNLGCYEEYHLRTSNRFLRKELFQMENGVCINCKLDCHKLVQYIKPLSVEARREYVKRIAPTIASREKLFEKLVIDPIEGNAWHADHIVPVYRGGGECRLENMRTLCVACHYDVTVAQLAERRLARTKAKKQLKILMAGLKNAEMENLGCADANLKEDHLNVKDTEDELLIEIPGSSYGSGHTCIGNE